MTASMRHSGGIVDAVLELGFDTVKYFEGEIQTTAVGFTIAPPARRLVLNNRSESGNLYLRIDGQPAQASVSFAPGDNIKIGPLTGFIMDFDALHSISVISDGSVNAEGLLGFKGIK